METDIIIRGAKQKEYPKPEPGLHNAVCSNIFDIGVQKSNYNNIIQFKNQIIICWELEARQVNEDLSGGQRFRIYKTYNLSQGKTITEKSKLKMDLETWRGKAFTDKELEGFNLSVLIGVPCTLNLIENKSKTNGKTYLNIASLSKKMPSVQALTPETDRTIIPQWIKDKIEEGKRNINSQNTQPEIIETENSIENAEDIEKIPF